MQASPINTPHESALHMTVSTARIRHMKHPRLLAGQIALALVLSVSTAHAQTAEGVVPAAYATQLSQGRKLGEGTMRWFGLKLYDAQLFTEKPAAQFNHRSDRHLLELRYDKAFDGAKIAEASREQIEGQGVGNAQLWPVWQKKLTDIIPDVQKDTRLAALYLPGKGLQLFRDGQAHAELNDPELAAAFMGIWLDTRTSEPKLRERLLGLRK